jgi:hypothetical protein
MPAPRERECWRGAARAGSMRRAQTTSERPQGSSRIGTRP